jgi:hypothetical protein
MAFEGDIISFADQGLANEDHRSQKNNMIVLNKFYKFIMVLAPHSGLVPREQIRLQGAAPKQRGP